MPQADGRPLRHHLESVYRQTGRRPPELDDAPECPNGLWHLWHWFNELAGARRVSETAIEPIGYQDIDAWSRLTGTDPTPEEVTLLRAADNIILSALQQKRANRKQS